MARFAAYNKADADHANELQSSLEVVTQAKLEPSVRDAEPMSRYQFERLGYFCVDADARNDRIVFNRTVTLKETWKK